MTILALVFCMCSCGSSDTGESEEAKQELSFVGTWEYVGSAEAQENIDDYLTAELTSDDNCVTTRTINDDGTIHDSDIWSEEMKAKEPVEDSEIDGTWEQLEDGVMEYTFAEGAVNKAYLTSDGSMLVTPVREEMIEFTGNIALIYKRK